MPELKQLIRETEVLVYAIGIDGDGDVRALRGFRSDGRPPMPFPFPIPGRRRPYRASRRRWPEARPYRRPSDERRVNARRCASSPTTAAAEPKSSATSRDLDPATAGIADELSQQYFLATRPQRKKDGRWHTIRVEVRNQPYRVRARKGYTAS